MGQRAGRRIAALLATCACLSLAAAGAGAAGKTATAKAMLAEARRAAAAWQKDAVLVSVTALQVAKDGTAPAGVTGWTYTFHAKTTGRWVAFQAGPRGLERQDLPSGYTHALPQDFVDSDRVLAEVLRNGFSGGGDTLATLLLVTDPSVKAGVYWCVAGEKDVSAEQGMRGYCVDPATGRFAARLAGRPAAPPAKPPQASRAGATLDVDFTRCGGFGAADAAAVLGVQPGRVTMTAGATGAGRGTCSFSAPGTDGIALAITVWKSVAEAEAEMERYRRSLNDAFSDLMGVGDDGVWTDPDGSYTGRKGNVTVRVTRPAGKIPQLKAARAFFDRL